MRTAIVLSCVLTTWFFGCRSAKSLDDDGLDPSVEVVPVPVIAAQNEPVPVAPVAAAKPSLLSLFTLSAAVIATVADPRAVACDACMVSSIVDKTAALEDAR